MSTKDKEPAAVKENPKSKPNLLKNPKNALIALAIIGVLVVAGFGGYKYIVLQQEMKMLKDNPQAASQKEVKDLVGTVSKLIQVPTDEQPTVASVADVAKLKDQPFFTNAQNGDKVLIYQAAKRAILYRPSTNKIIDVAPINVGSPSAQPVAPGNPTPTPAEVTVLLRNGTEITGLTKKYEPTLVKAVPTVKIVDRENAAKRDYSTSLLVDVTGTKSAQAAQLAGSLGMTVGPLPAGEDKPTNADFLIILGSDKQ